MKSNQSMKEDNFKVEAKAKTGSSLKSIEECNLYDCLSANYLKIQHWVEHDNREYCSEEVLLISMSIL